MAKPRLDPSPNPLSFALFEPGMITISPFPTVADIIYQSLPFILMHLEASLFRSPFITVPGSQHQSISGFKLGAKTYLPCCTNQVASVN